MQYSDSIWYKVMTSIYNNSYETFLVNNRIRINKYLNLALWLCALTGPAIAIGIFFHAFKDVTYSTCATLSALTILVALIHWIIINRFPESVIGSVYVFLVLDILLSYMAYSHIQIRLTWFLVPLLSLAYCNYGIFFISLFITYVTLCLSLYYTAPFYAGQRADISSLNYYFANVLSGNSIEMIVMAIAGIGILKTMQRHLKELLGTYSDIKNQETMVHDSVNTLKSMAGIYDNVNLLIFTNMTEVALRGTDSANSTHNIEGCDHTYMVNEMKKNISPDQLDSFMEFTDLRTLRDRLQGKKSIYAEFINVVTGWFRAQYITVETSEDGIPQIIVFTVQDIEKDKRKESNLIKMAHTDELTRLYNRRRYDEEICLYRENGLDQGFSLLSADVNGLKITNDTKGHAAGDELIKGAADCLHAAVAPYGQVYRTGGDEFMAILHIDDYTELISEIEARAKIWRGNYSNTLSISLGCVSHSEFPDHTVDELEHVADNRMYEAKERHYKEAGIDRRKK